MVSTIVPIPLSPEEVARKVADKMDFARESLLSKGEYLADPDILGRVAWEPVGSGHQLVIKPCPPPTPPTDTSDSDDPTAASTATSTPEPTIGSTAESTIESTTPPSPKGGNESPDTTNVPLPAIDAADEPSDIPSTPAILTIVVQLVPGASWLYPDAKWTKKNDYVPHFQDAKLLCTGGVPLHPAFIQDFDTSVDNLNTIMGELGDKRNKRTTVTTGKPGALVKIRHALFTVRSFLNAPPKCPPDFFPISHTMIRSWLIRLVCRPAAPTPAPFSLIHRNGSNPGLANFQPRLQGGVGQTHPNPSRKPPPGIRSKWGAPGARSLHATA